MRMFSVSEAERIEKRKRLERGLKKRKLKLWGVRKTMNTISPRNRFRAAVRKVIMNLAWMSDTTEEPLTDDVFLNEYIEAHRREEEQVLYRSDKYILKKHYTERTEEEITNLANKIYAFRCFRRYNFETRYKLMMKANFTAYNRSVILLRQGAPVKFVYVLVMGEGIAKNETKMSNGQTKVEIGPFKMGWMQGEFASLYNQPAKSTVIMDGPSEWLVLNKNEFAVIMKDTLKKHYFEVECALSKFGYFDKIGMFELQDYCANSFLSTFKPQTILPLYEGTVGLTYFIMEGRCSVVQKLVLKKDPTAPYPGYVLHEDQEAQASEDTEIILMRSCTISRRGTFGLGEESCKWCVMTDIETHAMIIPRFMLFKYNHSNIWNRLIDILDTSYPSNETLFEQFKQARCWAKYKSELSDKLSHDISGNTIHCVPYMPRAREYIMDEEAKKIVKSSPYGVLQECIQLEEFHKKFEKHPILKLMADFLPKEDTKTYLS